MLSRYEDYRPLGVEWAATLVARLGDVVAGACWHLSWKGPYLVTHYWSLAWQAWAIRDPVCSWQEFLEYAAVGFHSLPPDCLAPGETLWYWNARAYRRRLEARSLRQALVPPHRELRPEPR